MANVYSFRFLQELGLTSSATYTVPTGFVAVVNHIDAYEGASLSPDVLYFEGDLGQAVWFAESDPTKGINYASYDGRSVFFEAETFTMRAASGTWDVTVCGYLLTTP